MSKKLLVLALAAVMMLGMFGLSGCSNGKTIEVDGWTLFQFNRSQGELSGKVNIISVNDASLVVDGVLTIPAKIDRYDIYGFGQTAPFISMGDTFFTIDEEIKFKRVVLSRELYVDGFFWEKLFWHYEHNDWKYVEVESETFEKIVSLPFGSVIVIIPDGSSQNFVNKFGQFYPLAFMEKSDYLEETQNG